MLQSLLAVLLSTGLATAVYFHEKSAIDLHGREKSAFGFSLGYQKGSDAKLVIGAPRYDNQGQVSQCSIQNIERKKTCNDMANINFNNFPELSRNRTLNPNQYFYLGASIVPTNNGFVTCAPLRTANTTTEAKYNAFGVCFAYDYTKKNPATLWPLHSDYELLIGGVGWSTLADEKNDRFIISQFFSTRNTVYSKMSKPENYTRLINNERHTEIIEKISIYGQAMTLGNYFVSNKMHYAFSMKTLTNTGAIDFFSTDDDFNSTLPRLMDDTIGSMFGASLCSADVTGDGLAELFVGAPAQVDDATSYDRGAVHVYTKMLETMELSLTMWGVKDGGRFGTTLASNDVDGDSYFEIIISAPFEKSGGELHILNGYEIHKVLKDRRHRSILVSDIPRTQTIAKSRSFGLSMQPIADYNENGSDELGVGSPEQSTVTLYKGVRAITVNVSSKFKSDVSPKDTELAFSSCVTVQKPPKPKIITTKLLVTNELIAENATFKNKDDANYEINLQTDGNNVGENLYEYCKDFNIISALSCKVNTTVSLKEDIQEETGFKNSWVTLSAMSQLTKESKPQCNCNGTACVPIYSVDLIWSGRNNRNQNYIVGSSNQETVTIVVRNNGTMGCDACAMVRVSGSLDHTLSCEPGDDGYKCELPTPFRAGDNKTIDIRLMTNTLSNDEKDISIDVTVYKTCDLSDEAVNSSLLLSYDFSHAVKNIFINGFTTELTLSDTELQDTKTMEVMLLVEQTFTIFNNQSFGWKNVLATIDVVNRTYIKDFKVRIKQAMQSSQNPVKTSPFQWYCLMNLAQDSRTELTVSTLIRKKDLVSFLRDDVTSLVTSELKLTKFPHLDPSKKLVTMMKLEREQTANNNPLVTFIIAFIVAVVLLLLIIFILYKLKFFKRKNKEELEELKKEVSNRSMKSAASGSSAVQQSAAQPSHETGLDMVDLIVDETPMDNCLTPAELNSLAAQAELGSKSELKGQK